MGDNTNNRGKSKENLYHRHKDMLSRCYNPKCCNYKHYGARGITVCDEWRGKDGYENFRKWAIDNGYSIKLSLDRIDNDGNYEPSNCRWTTQSIQNMSMRHKNTSGYVGICKHSSDGKWYGRVKVNKVCFYTGRSEDIKEAVRMRNDFIITHNLPNLLNEVTE